MNSNNYNVQAGQLVTLTAFISGNQRSQAAAADDDVNLGFTTVGISKVLYANAVGPGVPSDPSPAFSLDPSGDGFGFDYNGDPGSPPLLLIPADQPYESYSLSFIPAQSGTIQAFIGTDSADNIGPVLGLVTLDISAVPEPGTWTLMMAGVSLMGAAMRYSRRKAASLLA